MKHLIVLILSLFIVALPSVANDVDLPSNGDLWDNWSNSQNLYGQDKPAVSDEEFDKALQSIKDKKNKLGNWLKKRQIPRGKEFSQSNESDIINNEIEIKDSLHVICIPVELALEDGVLPVGHYSVKAQKNDNGEIELSFYQAQYLMAKLPAIETTDDFGQDTIAFIKWLPEGDDIIKIIYGSMEFIAYTFAKLKQY